MISPDIFFFLVLLYDSISVYGCNRFTAILYLWHFIYMCNLPVSKMIIINIIRQKNFILTWDCSEVLKTSCWHIVHFFLVCCLPGWMYFSSFLLDWSLFNFCEFIIANNVKRSTCRPNLCVIITVSVPIHISFYKSLCSLISTVLFVHLQWLGFHQCLFNNENVTYDCV